MDYCLIWFLVSTIFSLQLVFPLSQYVFLLEKLEILTVMDLNIYRISSPVILSIEAIVRYHLSLVDFILITSRPWVYLM